MEDVYSICLIPAQEDEKYLSDIIKDLCEKHRVPTFVPHITIYGDIKVDFDKLRNTTENSMRGISSFTVRPDGINHSDVFFKTVFIDIRRSKILKSLHKKLREELIQYKDFILDPHISLIYKNIPTKERVRIVRNLTIKKKYTINQVAIFTPKNKQRGWYDVARWEICYRKKFG